MRHLSLCSGDYNADAGWSKSGDKLFVWRSAIKSWSTGVGSPLREEYKKRLLNVDRNVGSFLNGILDSEKREKQYISNIGKLEKEVDRLKGRINLLKGRSEK